MWNRNTKVMQILTTVYIISRNLCSFSLLALVISSPTQYRPVTTNLHLYVLAVSSDQISRTSMIIKLSQDTVTIIILVFVLI